VIGTEAAIQMINRRRRRILLVEHDPLMAKIVARELERHHRVFVVPGISAAMRKLTVAGGPVFDVVITAYRLRGETGIKLLSMVARRWPYIRRLLYADSELIPADKAEKHSHAVIQLPGTFDELHRAVDE
jgi:DNA-binding NtrC family response regulator